MANFFKSFGKGVLYLLVLPVLVIVLAIYAVGAFFIFLYLAIKGLILFFTGRSLFDDLPEDKEAKKRLALATPNEKEGPTININGEGRPIINSTPVIDSPDGNEVDPFYVPDYLKTPEQKEQLEQENMVQEEQPEPDYNEHLQDDILPMEEEVDNEPPLVEPNEEDYHDIQIENETPILPVEEEKEMETISTTKSNPNTTIIEINDLEDDDDDNRSGVDITFDD